MLLKSTLARAETDQVAQGRALYLQYCAACHGITGEGNGPLAGELITPPRNLRMLWERYGTPLPKNQIASFIDGREYVSAHGPREMPVWGERFYSEARGGERRVRDRIAKLLAYLQSIQTAIRHASAK